MRDEDTGDRVDFSAGVLFFVSVAGMIILAVLRIIAWLK